MALIELVGIPASVPVVARNALEIVNAIQRRLRMPLSSTITDTHAALILSFVNSVLTNGPGEGYVWDALKWGTTVPTTQGIALYQIARTGYEIDVIRHLQIGTNEPIALLPDPAFREYKRFHTAQERPLYYRHYGESGGGILIEVTPTPDAAYNVDTETLLKAKRLVLATDIPMIDPELLILGGLALAKEDQGDDFTLAAQEFGTKLANASTRNESNWGDVDPW